MTWARAAIVAAAREKSGYPAAFVAVAAGWAVFAWPWLSGEVTIPYDAKAHFQPQLQFLANALHSGQSPFWTPNVFGGSPQIADPQSLIFSPAFLLAYFDAAPSFRSFDLYCFLLLGLAALSVLMFFKDRGWHPAGAAVAALAVAFGGSSIWRIQHIKQIEGFAFSILCLWLLARALDRKSVVYGMLAGFAAGVMIVEPGQIAMLGCYILAAYTLDTLLRQPVLRVAARQSAAPLAAGGAVALALAALPIALTYLFVRASNRPEIPFSEAGRGALHPASLLTGIVGDLFGARSSSVHYWGPASGAWTASWLSMSENMGQIYLGALPALLILTAGLVWGRLWAREVRFFAAAAAVLLLFALGWYTPVFRLFYDYVPGVPLFRRPADATYHLGAMLAISAGYLVHRYVSDPDARTGPARWAVSGGVLGLVFVCAAATAVYHGKAGAAWRPIGLALILTVAAYGTLKIARRISRHYAAGGVAALAAFMAADLAINNGPNKSTAQPPADFEMLRPDSRNETIRFLKEHTAAVLPTDRRDRVEIVGLGFAWPNVSLVNGFDHVLGYNPLRLGEIIEAMGADETVAEVRERRFTPLFPSYKSMLANMLGLRYIALSAPIETVDKKLTAGAFPLVERTRDAFIYENPDALPRASFASSWERADFGPLVKSGQWPPFDPRKTVLLDKTPESRAVREGTPALDARSTVTLTRYDNTAVDIEADTDRAGFVVLNDVWHPWWYATVDGNPAAVRRANVLFRAVEVPGGKHTVRFRFKPVSGAVREIVSGLRGRLTGETARWAGQPLVTATAPVSMPDSGITDETLHSKATQTLSGARP